MTDQQKIDAFRESIAMRLAGFEKMKPNPPRFAATIPGLRVRIAQQVGWLDEAEAAMTIDDRATARDLLREVEVGIEEDTRTILNALQQDIEATARPFVVRPG